MSKRHHVGEVVHLKPYSGFIINSHLFTAEITQWMGFCLLGCGDRDCQEWDLMTEPDGSGSRHLLPHVSECQMLDDERGTEMGDAKYNFENTKRPSDIFFIGQDVVAGGDITGTIVEKRWDTVGIKVSGKDEVLFFPVRMVHAVAPETND